MDTNVFRKFWVEVVGVDKPKLQPKVLIPRSHDSEVQDIAQQALVAEEQAGAAVEKAQLMERLAAVAGPFKEAVAANGPEASQLQSLFGLVKTSIGNQQFTRAVEALDLLEGLLDQRTGSAPGVARDDTTPTNRSLGVDDVQSVQKVSTTGDNSQLAGGLIPDPTDILKDLLKTATGPRSVKGKIVNHTDQTLELDEQGVNQDLPHGEYKQFPPDEIKPGSENGEFLAVNKDIAGGISLTGVEGEIRYFLNDGQTIWTLRYNNPRAGDNDAKGTEIKGPDAARFESIAHAGNGDEAIFTYTLKAKGGPGPKPAAPVTCTCKISNNTDQTLQLDSQGTSLNAGEFKTPPPNTVGPKQQVEFVVVSKTVLDVSPAGVEGRVRYLIDDQKTAWTVHFVNPRTGSSSADAQVDGSNKDQFDSPAAAAGQGENATFLFALNAKGGSQQAVSASCLITVTNKTKSVLTLINQNNEHGDFMTNPASTVQPGGSTTFAFVETPREKDPKEKGCKGSVTWNVGSPAVASWSCEWDNPLGEKNTAESFLAPDGSGFQTLEQIGQGDENVPVNFTISGGGDDPVPPEEEPEFNAPPPTRQPTLRFKDQSVDGWVEYLQQLLNSWMKAEPEKYKDPTPVPVSGNFDARTLTVVREFQGTHNCQVDGTVGNQTWAALRQAPPEAPSTDGRTPHTFVEHGAQARWYTEHGPCFYHSSSDTAQMVLCSVGDAQIQGGTARIRVTAPGKKPKVVDRPIDVPPFARTPDDQGDLHSVTLDKFMATFPSDPPGASPADYFIEAYVLGLGNDSWSGKMIVQ